MAAATGSVTRKTRKGRTVPAVQPSTKIISSNTDTDTTAALQLQYLRAHAVASASLAAVIASLAWGVRHA